MRSAQELTFVEVVRPVQATPNVERLLNSARTFASVIFEADEAVDIVTVTDREIVGEDGPAWVGAQPEFCRIYNSDGLRVPLLERITVDTRAGNSFSAAARAFREGRKPSKKEQQAPNREQKPSERPIKEVLNDMQVDAGYEDPHSMLVRVAKDIGFRFLGNLQNGSVELVLVPDLSDGATSLLHRQSQQCHERLEDISKGVAFPMSPQHLEIPFARLNRAANPDQIGRFIEQVRTVLPKYVTLDEPRTLSQISS